MTPTQASVVIVAKAPRPGLTKTRLQPLLGPEGCARLQVALIRHTLSWATALAPGAVFVAYTPLDAAGEMQNLVPPGTHLFAQTEGDLGRRLEHAVAHVYALRPAPLVLVATDAPTLDGSQAQAALRALEPAHDACFVPAHDGGYVLLALRAPFPALFRLPSALWGGKTVLAESLALAVRTGLSARALASEPDLDEPADALALASDSRVPAAIAQLLRAPESGSA